MMARMATSSFQGSGTGPVDASAICRHQVFRSASLAQSRDYMRAAIIDHDLRCSAGEVDSALYTADTGRLQMMVLRYGPEVEVAPRPFEGFSLVQVPLRGSTEIECDGHRMSLHPGQSALVSPRRKLRVVWSEGCEQLIVRIPHKLVEAAVQTSEDWRRAWPRRSALLEPATMIDGAAGTRWNRVVQSLIDMLALGDEPTAVAHPAWIQHSELGAAVFLLTLQQGLNEALVLDDGQAIVPERRLGTERDDPLLAAERYVRSRLCAPIALEDLARASGVSDRTLHLYCKRRFGVGPMEWLRNLRLDAARERLQQSRRAQVTEVALSCGFGHLGRFAAYYRDRFGELPRETAVN